MYVAVIAGPGCLKEHGSKLWVYVFLGNALRGIGESPLMPLGISYIDDFSQSENAALYIGKLYLLFYIHEMNCLQVQ